MVLGLILQHCWVALFLSSRLYEGGACAGRRASSTAFNNHALAVSLAALWCVALLACNRLSRMWCGFGRPALFYRTGVATTKAGGQNLRLRVVNKKRTCAVFARRICVCVCVWHVAFLSASACVCVHVRAFLRNVSAVFRDDSCDSICIHSWACALLAPQSGFLMCPQRLA